MRCLGGNIDIELFIEVQEISGKMVLIHVPGINNSPQWVSVEGQFKVTLSVIPETPQSRDPKAILDRIRALVNP